MRHKLNYLFIVILAAISSVLPRAPGLAEETYQNARKSMVKDQLEARGITDRRVLFAMRKVPRHLFVSPEHRTRAYGDYPLPIGFGQTISQPYIVALMTELLNLRKEAQIGRAHV